MSLEVLIAVLNDDTANEITAILEKSDYETYLSINEDVESGGLRKAYRYQPDICIVDIKTAQQRDWYLIKELRVISSKMPIIVIIDDDIDLSVAEQMGATHFIKSPITNTSIEVLFNNLGK